MDFSGKTCLVTGANSGLGFEVAKRFAASGADTILVCRNQDKGENARREIQNEFPSSSVKAMICDLSSIGSIRNFIEAFKEQHAKLDILYDNAAVMKQKRTLTEDGLEMMFQVNFLGAFILMNSFSDLLKKGSDPTIINNGRPSEKLRVDFDDLQFERKYSMYACFFKTKLYLLFTTLELSRRLAKDGIAVALIDPGPFKSKLVRDMALVGFMKNLFSAPVEKAAENLLSHVTAGRAEALNGKVFKEKAEYPLTDYWKDKKVSAKVWDEAEYLLKDITIEEIPTDWMVNMGAIVHEDHGGAQGIGYHIGAILPTELQYATSPYIVEVGGCVSAGIDVAPLQATGDITGGKTCCHLQA